MKKIFFAYCISALFLFASCQKINTAGKDSTISGTIAEWSKTSLGGEQMNEVFWSDKDDVVVVLNDGLRNQPEKNCYKLISGKDTKKATFECSSGALPPEKIVSKGAWVLYPYIAVNISRKQVKYTNYCYEYIRFCSTENYVRYYSSYKDPSTTRIDYQVFDQNPFRQNGLPMYAVVESGSDGHGLHFKHICGIIKFVFTSKSQKTINQVTLSASNVDNEGNPVSNPLPLGFYVSNSDNETGYYYENSFVNEDSSYLPYYNGCITVIGCGDTSYSTNYVKTVYMVVPPLDGYYNVGYNGQVQFPNKYVKVEPGHIRTINIAMN